MNRRLPKIFITVVKVECPCCHGGGMIEHPFFAEFIEQGLTNSGVASSHDAAYWAERGIDVDHLPPEQVGCSTCEGTGLVDFELDPSRKMSILGKLSAEDAKDLSDKELNRVLSPCVAGTRLTTTAKMYRDLGFISLAELKQMQAVHKDD